ncbi:acetyltransferase [Ruminococcaceae bacterium OttesenSCG-928-O06]|nr:acetyltransferase [Ruminococcaceae bacterium OttesenSCG-928-O06]
MGNDGKIDKDAVKLTLRPFEDADIALMERWLYVPHVARWYKHPGHWLDELRQRHGAFSFLTHFIAEVEGAPIGFCQYYDTFYAQAHEVWGDEWDVREKPGSIFSIDYLIGEAAYLRRGFGRQMILQMLKRLQTAGAKTVIVEPEEENAASGGALTACGFVWDGKGYHKALEKN